MNKGLQEAAKDFRYLLSRNYKRESALAFVGDKYQLNKNQRLTLYRCIYDPKTAKQHRKKLLPIKGIKGKTLEIDGYNVLITIETMLSTKKLIECDDGFIRDVSEVHGKHKPTLGTEKALKLVLKTIKESKPKKINFFYDSEISRSGELAALTRQLIKNAKLEGNAEAIKNPDTYLIKSNGIIASSDAVIIEKAKKIVDLGGEIVRKKASRRAKTPRNLNVCVIPSY